MGKGDVGDDVRPSLGQWDQVVKARLAEDHGAAADVAAPPVPLSDVDESDSQLADRDGVLGGSLAVLVLKR